MTDITTRKQVQEAESRALRAAVANEAKNQFLATSIFYMLLCDIVYNMYVIFD